MGTQRRLWLRGQRRADQHPPPHAQAAPAPRRPLESTYTHTHTHTHTLRHTFPLTRAAALTSQLTSRCPQSPLPGQAQVPLGRSSPLPRGGQQAGAGEGAPESQAKLPLIRAGRGGAPTSERGLPGGGHLRTSPPTHAAVWAPSPASPAPPSFRQLRPASPPTPHPCGNAWGGGRGEGEYRGDFSQDAGGGAEEGKCGDALGARRKLCG